LFITFHAVPCILADQSHISQRHFNSVLWHQSLFLSQYVKSTAVFKDTSKLSACSVSLHCNSICWRGDFAFLELRLTKIYCCIRIERIK
jgi:hypothetical protein